MPEFERPVPGEPGGPRSGDVIESGYGPRRPWRTLAAATVILAAIGFVVADETPSGVRAPAGSRSLSPSRTATPAVVPAPLSFELGPVTLDLPGKPFFFDVGPGGYGVVVTADCSDDQPCTGGLATSTDLRQWVRRPLPRDGTDRGAPVPLVLGHGVLLLLNFGTRNRGWLSHDGGLTWRRVAHRRGGDARQAGGPATSVTPATAPDEADASDGRLALRAVDRAGAGACGSSRVAVYRRDSARLVPLRHQPGLEPCSVTPFHDLAGRVWVAGLDPASGRAAVAMSRDSGRTWTRTRLPDSEGATYVSVTFSGSSVYAVVIAPGPGGGHEAVTAIFRYDGAGWVGTWRPGGAEAAGIGQVLVCPGGLLLAGRSPHDRHADARLLVSRNAGRDWVRAERVPPIFATAVPGHGWYGWYGWYGWDDADRPRLIHSPDCRTWYGVPVG